jgi:hypothetical protein
MHAGLTQGVCCSAVRQQGGSPTNVQDRALPPIQTMRITVLGANLGDACPADAWTAMAPHRAPCRRSFPCKGAAAMAGDGPLSPLSRPSMLAMPASPSMTRLDRVLELVTNHEGRFGEQVNSSQSGWAAHATPPRSLAGGCLAACRSKQGKRCAQHVPEPDSHRHAWRAAGASHERTEAAHGWHGGPNSAAAGTHHVTQGGRRGVGCLACASWQPLTRVSVGWWWLQPRGRRSPPWSQAGTVQLLWRLVPPCVSAPTNHGTARACRLQDRNVGKELDMARMAIETLVRQMANLNRNSNVSRPGRLGRQQPWPRPLTHGWCRAQGRVARAPAMPHPACPSQHDPLRREHAHPPPLRCPPPGHEGQHAFLVHPARGVAAGHRRLAGPTAAGGGGPRGGAQGDTGVQSQGAARKQAARVAWLARGWAWRACWPARGRPGRPACKAPPSAASTHAMVAQQG